MAFSTRPPCPSATFGCDDGTGLRGTSRLRAPWGRVDQWPDPRDLRISFEDALQRALLLRRLPLCFSWPEGPPLLVESEARTPLMGLSKFAPPSASVQCVHSQLRRCSEELSRGWFPREPSVRRGVAFGAKLPRSALVPPLPFLPASTVCSAFAPFQACCILEPIMGFTRFQPERLVSCAVPGGCRPADAGLSPPCRPGLPRRVALTGAAVGFPLPPPRRKAWSAFVTTSALVLLLGIPTGAPPFEAFPLPAAWTASTGPSKSRPASSSSAGKPAQPLRAVRLRPLGPGPP